MTPLRVLMVLVAGLALAACGGGGSALPAADAQTVPNSATASPDAFVQYVGALPAEDTAEPVTVDNLMPPKSEAEEPKTVL